MADGQCPRSLPATERISFQLIWGPRANSEPAVCKPTTEAPPLPNPYLQKRQGGKPPGGRIKETRGKKNPAPSVSGKVCSTAAWGLTHRPAC